LFTNFKEFPIKNTIKIVGIIALIAVIGFTMAACDNDSTDDDKNGNKNSKGNGNDGSSTMTWTAVTDSTFGASGIRAINGVFIGQLDKQPA